MLPIITLKDTDYKLTFKKKCFPLQNEGYYWLSHYSGLLQMSLKSANELFGQLLVDCWMARWMDEFEFYDRVWFFQPFMVSEYDEWLALMRIERWNPRLCYSWDSNPGIPIQRRAPEPLSQIQSTLDEHKQNPRNNSRRTKQ